jgi:hypothetical protein
MTREERVAELLAAFSLADRLRPRHPGDSEALQVHGGSVSALRRDMAAGRITFEKRPGALRGGGRGAAGRTYVTLQSIAYFRADCELAATATPSPATARRIARDLRAVAR